MDLRRWQRIDQLLQLALERGEEERAELLDRECGGDAELGQRVESLLRLDAGEVPLLDGLPSAGEDGRELDDLPLRPGEQVGPYRLGERLGEGGMSVVFAAERVDEHLERRVALKFLKRSHLGRVAVARFRNEGRILARLDHPNVARIYDAGTTATGIPYLVMERVDGRRIDEFCRLKGLAVAERLAVFLAVLEAVAFAHRHLIVHRDLKPGNVLVSDGGVPKLLDFGIAKLLEPPPGSAGLTRTAFQPMTPQYASPEQLAGEPVTTASDVYSLGLVLYELLTGLPPYRLESISSAAIARLSSGAMAIPRPSAELARRQAAGGEPAMARGEVRPDLDRVVLKALSGRPEDRYLSVEPFADDLRRYLGGYPVLAHAPSRLYRCRRFVARHRLAVTAGAAAVFLLLALTSSLAFTAGALARERDRVRAEAATAEQVGALLAGLFEAAEPAASRGVEITARQLLDLGAHRLAVEEGRRPEVRAALAAAIGKAYLELSRLAEARPLLEAALRLRRQALPPGDPRIADALDLLSELEFRGSAYEPAEALAGEAVALRRAAGGTPEALAGSLLQLASARMQRGEVDGAEPPLVEALALASTTGQSGSRLEGRILKDLGVIAGRRGEWAQAEGLTRRAVDLLAGPLGLDHPLVLEARRDLATFSSRGPDGIERAVTVLRELLADQQRVLGQDHEQVLWTALTLASHLSDLQRHGEARRLYEQSLVALEASLGPDHLAVGVSLVGLGHTLDRAGDLDGAERALRRGLAIHRRRLGPDAAEQAHPLRLLAEVLRRKGEPRAAEAMAREALGILERRAPGDEWYLPLTRVALARALADQGRLAEAKPLLREACRSLEAKLGPADPNVRIVQGLLAEVDRAAGRPQCATEPLVCAPAPAAR